MYYKGREGYSCRILQLYEASLSLAAALESGEKRRKSQTECTKLLKESNRRRPVLQLYGRVGLAKTASIAANKRIIQSNVQMMRSPMNHVLITISRFGCRQDS